MQTIQTIQNAVKAAVTYVEADGDVSFTNTYSGRGMYGRCCIGIVGSLTACQAVIAQAIKDLRDSDEFEEAVDILLNFNQDSMGRSDVVLYWQDLEPLDKEVA